MKKLLVSSLSVIALAILGTGCLKDKDFEDQVYGTQPGYNPAVSIPAAAVDEIIPYGLISQSTPFDLVGPHIALEGTGPISSDVHVTLAVDNALVDSANVHNPGLGLIVLNPSEYVLNLNRTIVAGHAYDSVVVTINNLAGLDPNNTYAIGVKIASVDNGFQIVSPQQSIVIQINIRNMYDGIYTVESGWTTRYDASGIPLGDALSGDLTGNPDVYLVTTGPYSVGIPAPPGPGQLAWAAGSNSSVAGIDGLEVTVDGSNNTSILSATLANLANWAGHDNFYDPATQTFHIAFQWTNTAGAPRDYEIVLKFKEPRP
ncbi:MAG: DUF1735 domain-containing protein [Ferruginibacter sp.]